MEIFMPIWIFYKNISEVKTISNTISFLMEIISFILTLITFLTVTMSVQYQEYIYKSKELVFDIKNSKCFEKINKYLEKIGYIDEGRYNYDICTNSFVVISYLILFIITIIVPIYYVKAKPIIIVLIGFVLIVFDATIYLLYKVLQKDSKNINKKDLLNAIEYKNNYNNELIIFPEIIFTNNNFCVVQPKLDLKNYILVVDLEYSLSEREIVVFKRGSEDEKKLNQIEMYSEGFELNNEVRNITYGIKIKENWEFFDVNKSTNNDNKLELRPVRRLENRSANMLLESAARASVENKIVIYNPNDNHS